MGSPLCWRLTCRTRLSIPQSDSRYLKAVDAHGDLVAIGAVVLPNLYHPVLVL